MSKIQACEMGCTLYKSNPKTCPDLSDAASLGLLNLRCAASPQWSEASWVYLLGICLWGMSPVVGKPLN